MPRTYRNLKEVLHLLSTAQNHVIMESLTKMDDLEFQEIPTIFVTADAKRVIETYAHVLMINRGTPVSGIDSFVTVYCLSQMIFKMAS
jgi:ABC-type sulfate/molybdate transport systems ATPase subunit